MTEQPIDEDTVRQDIDALAAVLDQASNAADKGLQIDLSGLDAQIASVCAAAHDMPTAQAKALLADLDRIIRGLDSLGTVLSRQRDALQAAAEGRADPHTARRRAAAAYGHGPIAEPIEIPIDPKETP